MKLKKLLAIFFISFLMTGCSVEYHLTVEKESIKEKITFTYINNEENKKTVENIMNNQYAVYYDIDLNKTEYYNKELTSDRKNMYITYTYDYLPKNLIKSNMINSCYYKKDVLQDDNYIILKTEGAFSCLYDDYSRILDNAVIKIETKYKVEKHNADKVSGNVYIWKIDDSNYKDKPIYIKINYDKMNDSAHKRDFMFLGIGLCLIVIVGAILITFIILKGKDANKI